MYMRLKEVADYFNVSPSTIYKEVKAGRLSPVNKDTYHADGGYLFLKSEIEKLKPLYENRKKDGFTINEVARKVGVSPATVRTDIRTGLLKAEQIQSGRKEYRVTAEALAEYEKIKKPRERATDFKYGDYYLFQKIAKRDLTARIVAFEDGAARIQYQSGATESIPRQTLKDWRPVQPLPKKNIVTYPGEVVFHFPRPEYIDHPVYQLLDLLVQQAGVNNVYIIGRDKIEIRVKRTVLPKSVFSSWLDTLKRHLVVGSIIEGHQEYILQPDCYLITTHVSEEIKQRIQKEAEKEGKSMQEWLRDIIIQALKKSIPLT